MPQNINIPLTKKQAGIVLAVLVVAALAFFYIQSNLRSTETLPEISLSVWGMESPSRWSDIINAYEERFGNVDVSYTQVSEANYDNRLLTALAGADGPDVFLISNRDLAKRKDIISPAPSNIINLQRFSSSFPDVAIQDFVDEGEIYALPLYIDTLALLYNKDMLNQAGIAEPPETWGAFQQTIPRLRALNPQGKILTSAAAIGGTQESIPYAADLLSLLIFQNGGEIINQRGSANLDDQTTIGALEFYTEFANRGSSLYTWNDARGDAFASFVSGDTAMVFGYREDVKEIPERNPFLRMEVAFMPQVNPNSAVNYPRYHGISVSNQSESPGWAWNFAGFVSATEAGQTAYTNSFNRTPALRSLISETIESPAITEDATIGTPYIFARQALTARSWPIVDYQAESQALNEAIAKVLDGRLGIVDALKQAESQFNLIR